MDNNMWVLDRETTIYSKIKAQTLSRLKKAFPDLNITRDGRVQTEPMFPNVFISFLQPVEQGNDLENKTINAVLLTIQVEVTVTQEQGLAVADSVSWTILDIAKSMGFNASMPYYDTTSNKTYRTISRFTRTIGYNDTL